MAGKGPAGTGNRIRKRNEGAVKAQFTTVVPDEEPRGFALPEDVLPGGDEWHPMTVRWWNAWRVSPQAQQMLETDWEFMLETALLHHVMWSKGRWEYASEVRLRVAKFGATPEDRMRLKLTVQTAAVEEPAPDTATPADTSARRRNMRIVG